MVRIMMKPLAVTWCVVTFLFIGLVVGLPAVAASAMPTSGGVKEPPVTSRRLQAAIAYAQVLTVTTNDDAFDGSCTESHCSLREAIAVANARPGSDAVLITFQAPYTIVLTYMSGGAYRAFPEITRNNITIDGDLNDDGRPDVVIDGRNIADSTAAGLFIKADNVTVEGLVIQRFPGWGIDIHGNRNTVRFSYLGTSADGRGKAGNKTGLLLTNGASQNVITATVIAGNTDDGVLISARYAVTPSPVITPAHDNIIANSYIGTNPWGDALGNGDKGIVIQRGAYGNVVQNNVIANNGCYGVYLLGRYVGDVLFPPQNNEVRGNTVERNAAACPPGWTPAGVVSVRTHRPPGTTPSASGGYDNVIADNVIRFNTFMGIWNNGASPLIQDNVLEGNGSREIYNQVDLQGTEAPADAGDDIVSVPIIVGNRISGTVGIRSLDTAPAFRRQLHLSNTITTTGNRVEQVWYGAVEVITGTPSSPVPLSSTVTVKLFSQRTGRTYTFDQYDGGLWGRAPFVADTVRRWPALMEFEVTRDGNVLEHDPYTVFVLQGNTTIGSLIFSFDGLTATHAISPDQLIPWSRATGPYGRYQAAEVNLAYSSDGAGGGTGGTGDSDNDGIPDYLDTDSDGDGIPDADEGTGDTDGDGVPDYLDTDSDGDGIPDSVEGADDTDGDGVPNYLDTDADGDGVPDSVEGSDDTDGDGVPDFQDTDDDNDGIPTADEYDDPNDPSDALCGEDQLDSDGDGAPNCEDNDADGDGIPNYLDTDADGDGIPDAVEKREDRDGDGVLDFLDPGYAVFLPVTVRDA